ncbi:MAG: homoserine kinase [Myxococcota bacterium]
MHRVRAFAPATVGNVGVGFDILGMALEHRGDQVEAFFGDWEGVRIVGVEGDAGRLPVDVDQNTAGIAGRFVWERYCAALGAQRGVGLQVRKGLPLGSGLGSSAASAVAAAYAVHRLLGGTLAEEDLFLGCLEAEARVSGRHADNAAPAWWGGCCLVVRLEPLKIVQVRVPDGLHVALVKPKMEVSSKDARAVLSPTLTRVESIEEKMVLGLFLHAMYSGELGLLRDCQTLDAVTSARLPLIPGAKQAIDAALSVGALMSSISGAGPSMFALVEQAQASDVVQAMQNAFLQKGLESDGFVSVANAPGVRLVDVE